MTNLDVMLAGRPEIKEQLAPMCAGSMVPFPRVLEWLNALAGTSSSMHDFSKAQADRIRDLELQVEKLTEERLAANRGDIGSMALELADVSEVVLAAMRETEYELAHNPDGTWPPGTTERLAVARKWRAAAVQKLSDKRRAESEARQRAAHSDNCTGCAACETAGA